MFVVTLTGGVSVVMVATVALAIGPLLLVRMDTPVFQTWRTVFAAIAALAVQGLPFMLFAAAISAFVPASVFSRVLPRNPALAVPVAGAAGVVLPGCECASVPVAGSLMGRGVAPAAALSFLLSAPAVNPVVLVATAVAFPGSPEMVVARLVEIHGVKAPAADTWVLVTGEWRPIGEPGSPDADPELDADSIKEATEPTDPYEDNVPDLSAS